MGCNCGNNSRTFLRQAGAAPAKPNITTAPAPAAPRAGASNNITGATPQVSQARSTGAQNITQRGGFNVPSSYGSSSNATVHHSR